MQDTSSVKRQNARRRGVNHELNSPPPSLQRQEATVAANLNDYNVQNESFNELLKEYFNLPQLSEEKFEEILNGIKILLREQDKPHCVAECIGELQRLQNLIAEPTEDEKKHTLRCKAVIAAYSQDPIKQNKTLQDLKQQT